MARTFIALTLTPKVRQRLSEESDRLRLTGAQVAWVRQENYHITLRFLGDIADEELLVLDPLLREIAAERPPLRLVVKGLGTFIDRRTGDPRAVWCGAEPEDGEDGLQLLRKEIEHRLARSGYRRDKSEFVPHVTLGRFRGTENLGALMERLGPAVRREFAHFNVTDLVLFETVSTPQGIVYEPLQRFPFGVASP